MSRRRGIGKALREVAAMATQARYMSRDLGMTIREGTGPNVVLLHGLYASAGVWRPLRRRLEQQLDASTFSVSYVPGPGIAELTARISDVVQRVPGRSPIVLVGHSLGGLVMRSYARQPSCDERVVQTISLASPFLGSSRNWLVPGQAGRDIAPDSALLSELRAPGSENERVPHLALVAEEDDMIVPGAYPSFGEHRLIVRVGHNGILFSDETIRRVVTKVDQATRVGSPGASFVFP